MNGGDPNHRLLLAVESIAASLQILAQSAQAQRPAHRVSALNDTEKELVHERRFNDAIDTYAARVRCNRQVAAEEVNWYGRM